MQLDLFAGPVRPPAPAALLPVQASAAWRDAAEVPRDPGEAALLAAQAVREGQQLLFGEGSRRAAKVREAIDAFDLEAAALALAAALEVEPCEPTLLARREAVAQLLRRLREERAAGAGPALALLRLRPEVQGPLRAPYLRALAARAEEELGPCGLFEGEPVGLLWLQAGEWARAEAALRLAALGTPGDCRLRGYLGDALLRQDRLGLARVEYRNAFANGPHQVDLAALADEQVALLPQLGRDEYGLCEPLVEWVAAVGTAERLFAIPTGTPPPPPAPEVPAGLRCLRWLERAALVRDPAGQLEARRALKSLAPALLARWLGREA